MSQLEASLRLRPHRPLLGIALALLLCPFGPAQGAESNPCTDDLTKEQCYDAVVRQMVDERAEQEPEEVAQKATSSTLSNQNGSLLDLLPSFLGAVGLDGLNNDQGQLSFDKTFELTKYLRLAVGGEVLEPKIFEALDTKLDELDLEDLREDLSDEFGDFDSVNYRARLSLEGVMGTDHQFGRDPERYKWLTKNYYSEVKDDKMLRKLRTADSSALSRTGLTESIGALRARKGDTGVTALVAEARQDPMVKEAEKRLDQMTDLINNQPQFIIEANWKEREEITGPSEFSGSLCYEMGFGGNINDFMQWARNDGDPDCERSKWTTSDGGADGKGPKRDRPPYACYERYVELRGENAGERANRIALRAEYTNTDDFAYELPDGQDPFTMAASEKWTASFSYGRYLNDFSFIRTEASKGKEDRVRFNIEAKYDEPSGDEMRQSRFVATLTLTQAMTNSADLSVSAVYANRPEFLGEVDQTVSARFGLKFSGFGGGD